MRISDWSSDVCSSDLEAPYANLACVEAATRLPFDEGLAFEREQFMKLMFGSQSAAQRHIFFAERQAAKIDGLPKDTALRDIKKVGVIDRKSTRLNSSH